MGRSHESTARTAATPARQLKYYGLRMAAACTLLFVAAHVLVVSYLFPKQSYTCATDLWGMSTSEWTLRGVGAALLPKLIMIPSLVVLLLGLECPLAALGIPGCGYT